MSQQSSLTQSAHSVRQVLTAYSRRQLAIGRMLIESQLFELKRHIEAAGVIAPFLFPLVIG
jgi:hypothetical protein